MKESERKFLQQSDTKLDQLLITTEFLDERRFG